MWCGGTATRRRSRRRLLTAALLIRVTTSTDPLHAQGDYRPALRLPNGGPLTCI